MILEFSILPEVRENNNNNNNNNNKPHVSISGFQCVAKNIETSLMFCTLDMVYSQIWPYLSSDEHHFFFILLPFFFFGVEFLPLEKKKIKKKSSIKIFLFFQKKISLRKSIKKFLKIAMFLYIVQTSSQDI